MDNPGDTDRDCARVNQRTAQVATDETAGSVHEDPGVTEIVYVFGHWAGIVGKGGVVPGSTGISVSSGCNVSRA
jgi:hypothetical protein